MKRQDALIATQEILTLCDVLLLKKSRKTPKSDHFTKNHHFLGGFSWFFHQRYIRKSCGFCVAFSVFIWLFIWAIKHQNPMIFIFGLYWVFTNFQTPRTGGFWKKEFFFCIFLTTMYRSSDLAGSKHDWSFIYLVINTLLQSSWPKFSNKYLSMGGGVGTEGIVLNKSKYKNNYSKHSLIWIAEEKNCQTN